MKQMFFAVLAAGVLLGGIAGCMTEKQKEAKLEAKAKVTRAEAERIALAKVSNGTILLQIQLVD